MAFGIGSFIKEKAGKVANKVADKLIPKELAPFLPMLAPLFMGPGAGMMSRYLMPQLLTALSTGKTTGDISGTSQALAGLGSFLSDPNRLKLAEPIEAKDAIEAVPGTPGDQNMILPDSEQVVYGKLDPLTGEYVPQADQPLRVPENVSSIDGVAVEPGSIRDVGSLPNSYVDPNGNPINIIEANALGYDTVGENLMALPGSGQFKYGYGPGQVDPGFANPGTAPISAQAAVPGQPLSVVDNFMNTLKTGINESRDFIQGTNVANKTPFGEEVTVGEGSKLIGEGKFDPYTQSYAEFKDNPLTQYKIGDAVNVQDAGFGYNMPRRAVQQGIMASGPSKAIADKMQADADAEAAAFQNATDDYQSSRQALFDYFGNAQPNYNMLYGGFADGGLTSLKPKRGLVNEPGGYAGEEDDLVKALIEMMGPLPTTGGNNYQGPSIVGGTDYVDPFQELIDQGFFKVVRNVKQKANGGRVGLNMGGMGGIMNAGSIPQTPNVPQGMQLDGRGGGFIPMGAQERKDDVPAMLAKNEFVMTADAVRAAGGGSIEKGAQRMYDVMNQLEARA